MTMFVAGFLVLGYAIAALFFARFWRATRDRLFLLFAAAFAILAVHRLGLAVSVWQPFDPTWYYVARLLAFLVILFAVVDKNRSRRA